jgi:hypothetical protein
VVALGLTVFFAATSSYIAAHRLLWFDEVLTTLICHLPTVATVWKALSEVAERTPFLYFLIARAVDQLLGPSDLAVRFVSVLAFSAALLVTFDIARRLTNGPYGLIAMSFLATPFVTYYGHEARPRYTCCSHPWRCGFGISPPEERPRGPSGSPFWPAWRFTTTSSCALRLSPSQRQSRSSIFIRS